MEMIRKLLRRHYEIVIYLVFGVLTTVVNYIVYLPCYNLLGLSSSVSNAIAWIAAVIFAFLTNKPFVFHSRDWSAKTIIPELTGFIGTRLGSGGLETLILLVFVDWLGMDGNLWKLITSVLVVAVNYLGSKLLVFRGK